jgi:error-prone DNA polymerase
MNDNNAGMQKEAEVALPTMPLGEHVVEDYTTTKLSLKGHPAAFIRHDLKRRMFITAEELKTHPANQLVSIAGLVLVRQRPGTASGVIFATLEDETGVMNVIIWPKLFETERRTVIGSKFLGVVGMVQREESVIHVIAKQVMNLSNDLAVISGCDELFAPYSQSDEFKHGGMDGRDTNLGNAIDKATRVQAILPKGRNFH